MLNVKKHKNSKMTSNLHHNESEPLKLNTVLLNINILLDHLSLKSRLVDV